MDALIDITGWLGAIVLVSAYQQVSAGRLDGDGAAFQLLNLAGATALLANSGYHRAWPSAGLNAVWLVIGLIALASARRSAARERAAGQVAQGITTPVLPGMKVRETQRPCTGADCRNDATSAPCG